MKCPHCGMEVESGEKKCPYCYGILECGDDDNCPDDGCDEVKKAGSAKRRSVLIIAAAVIIIAAVVIIFLALRGSSFDGHPDATAATYEGNALDNRQLNYYYWSDLYYYLNSYGTSSFDPAAPLEQQQYDGTTTWQDYFVDSAVNNWRDITAVCAVARAENFRLPDDYQAALDGLEASLEDAAANIGAESAEDYLKRSYGQAADFDSFYSFLEDNYLANAYTDEIYDRLYDQYAVAAESRPTINVRHILIGTDSESDAKAKADEVYQIYLDGPHTEEAFAALADQYSTDPGSNTNGGLYENVTEGMMVQAFNDWCFAAGRKPGDTGIVETSYGYHIMYFVGQGESIEQADETVVQQKYTEWLDGITDGDLEVSNSDLEIYSSAIYDE